MFKCYLKCHLKDAYCTILASDYKIIRTIIRMIKPHSHTLKERCYAVITAELMLCLHWYLAVFSQNGYNMHTYTQVFPTLLLHRHMCLFLCESCTGTNLGPDLSGPVLNSNWGNYQYFLSERFSPNLVVFDRGIVDIPSV